MSVDNPTTHEPTKSSSGRTYPLWIGLATVVLVVLVPCAATVIPQILDMSDGGVRKIGRNVKELKAGKTKTLHVIGTRRTDSLLEQIRGMPEIEDVYMEDTDITAAGMRHLGTLPNLKTMMVYNGAAGDEGMLELRNCTKLESLAIYDTRITEDAIAELHRYIPSVRVGTKHDEGHPAYDPEVRREIEVKPSAPTSDDPSESN
jgi:hypothetical protein